MTGLLLAVETVVLALLTLLVIGLLRSHAEILRRLHDLGVDLDDPGPRAVTRHQFNVFPEAGEIFYMPFLHKDVGQSRPVATSAASISRMVRCPSAS